jgi:hypothetical protein
MASATGTPATINPLGDPVLKPEVVPEDSAAGIEAGLQCQEVVKWMQENNYERVKEAIVLGQLDVNATFANGTMGKIFFTSTTPILIGVRYETHSAVIGKEFTETPLSLAIACGSSAIVTLLLDSGANKETRASELSCTPLFLALCMKREDVAVLLLRRGANAKYSQKLLVKEMNKHTVGYLRTACRDPAKINAVPRSHDFYPVVLGRDVSMLHVAAIVGVSQEVVALLLDGGADFRAQAHFVARTYCQHMWQMCCTHDGVMTLLACGLLSWCAIPCVDTIMGGCLLPGTHNPSWGPPMPINIPRTAWELAEDFGHPFPPRAMAVSGQTGAPKEDTRLLSLLEDPQQT